VVQDVLSLTRGRYPWAR